MAKVGLAEWLAVGGAIAEGELLRYSAKRQYVRKFEERFGAMIGAKHVLAMTNGTSALTSALSAAGIGPGDEVLVPAYTWMATAAAPVLVGAVPVLVDIDETLTMDPADLERKITPQTKAIIPVHMVNAPANMDVIMRIARKHKLVVIEDACQAVGVRYKSKFCGAIGDMGAYSFNRFKNINIGEGGALSTNDDRLYARALNYHDLGVWARHLDLPAEEKVFVGHNYRVTEVQGAMLGAQLSKLQPMLKKWRERRRVMAAELSHDPDIRVSPHNDPENAVTLTVIFDRERDAEAFAKNRGVMRVYDNSKHVYTNWTAILEKRTAHPKLSPWQWAAREIDYSPDSCARTLDILKRTCRIGLGERWPVPVMRYAARRLVKRNPIRPGIAAAPVHASGETV